MSDAMDNDAFIAALEPFPTNGNRRQTHRRSSVRMALKSASLLTLSSNLLTDPQN